MGKIPSLKNDDGIGGHMQAQTDPAIESRVAAAGCRCYPLHLRRPERPSLRSVFVLDLPRPTKRDKTSGLGPASFRGRFTLLPRGRRCISTAGLDPGLWSAPRDGLDGPVELHDLAVWAILPGAPDSTWRRSVASAGRHPEDLFSKRAPEAASAPQRGSQGRRGTCSIGSPGGVQIMAVVVTPAISSFLGKPSLYSTV